MNFFGDFGLVFLHAGKHNFKARTGIVGAKVHFYVDNLILLCHKKFNLNSRPLKTKELLMYHLVAEDSWQI